MDVSLSEGQRAWQLKARQFAQEVIAPVSVERDRIPGAHAALYREIGHALNSPEVQAT
jgi:hypothetical protein